MMCNAQTAVPRPAADVPDAVAQSSLLFSARMTFAL
jgi:hypothetical protein